MKTIQEQISITKIKTHTKSPFLATLITMLPVEINNDIPTACTNGKRILINETFFTGLNQPQQQFLLAHEVMHIIYHHMTRKGDRNPYKWNCAGDYLINHKLHQQGFQLIPDCLHDPKYNDNWTTEQIYDDLPNELENLLDGDLEYTDSPTDQEQTTNIETQINQTIAKAVLQMDITGKASEVPNDIRRHIEQFNKPKVNWKILLRRYLFELDQSDYTWKKPRKKLLAQGYYLPKLETRNIGNIAIAIDTSGSISTEQFNQFISEVASVFNTLKPKSITLMQFDTQVYTNEIETLKELKAVEFKGGGGTNINPVIHQYNNSQNRALFVITDGYFFYPPIASNKPIYWIIHNNPQFNAPYGKTICLN